LVLFHVFLNEIQYGLLFFRKHARPYTEHSYGSQALVGFVPKNGMDLQRGSALVMALMLLTFLMILGSALLTSVTLDVAIGENYRSETQLLYLAEAGITEARNLLRDSSMTPSQLLRSAAGSDGLLSASRDLDTLLEATDDVPLINGGARSLPRLAIDTSGKPAGAYYVFLRNDAADGMTSLTDSNQVLALLSVAVLGDTRKVMEVTVRKWQFPKLPASLVMAGSPVRFTPADSRSEISGIDITAKGDDRHSIGVRTVPDQSMILTGIPAGTEIQYPGRGNPSPPPADVGVIDTMLDPRLRAPAGLERVVDRIVEYASDLSSPGWNGTTVVGNVGTTSDYRIVVVNGNCVLGPGAGYGILLVRGNLSLTGSFRWNGLVLVIGQGSIATIGTATGTISGGILVARTRADDRGPANELGTMLVTPGPVNVDFGGSGNSVQLENPGEANLDLVNQRFPYLPIAIREY
jgi:Tfp pilus assembly protein PilX